MLPHNVNKMKKYNKSVNYKSKHKIFKYLDTLNSYFQKNSKIFVFFSALSIKNLINSRLNFCFLLTVTYYLIYFFLYIKTVEYIYCIKI